MKVVVLRLGHRVSRDKRISTHCGLVARAFGANGIIYSRERDREMIKSVKKVSEQWGGKFEVSYEKNWRKVLKEHKKKGFAIAHLSVYGLPIQKTISKIRKNKKILLVIGGEKVPGDVYQLADFNISVTSQPHSELGALSVFLDRLFKGKELEKRFPKARKKIIPQEKGKRVIER